MLAARLRAGMRVTCFLQLLWFASLGLAMPATAQAPAAAASVVTAPVPAPLVAPVPVPCAIVFPQPRSDIAASTAWSEINLTFVTELAEALARAGRRVLRLDVPPGTAPEALVPALLDHAAAHTCTHLVESSLWVETEAEAQGGAALIVVRVRIYPVLQEGPLSRIGQAVSTHRQEFPNTAMHRDRLVPARLAEQFARDLLGELPAAGPVAKR
jgi:hypothetical protein